MTHRKQILELIAEQGLIGAKEYTEYADRMTGRHDLMELQYELEDLAKQTEYGEKDQSRDAYLTCAVILETVYVPNSPQLKDSERLVENAMNLEDALAERDDESATSILRHMMTQLADYEGFNSRTWALTVLMHGEPFLFFTVAETEEDAQNQIPPIPGLVLVNIEPGNVYLL